MPDATYAVDFAPYRFLLHHRPNLNFTPVPVDRPATKRQHEEVFTRLVHINPPRNADGGLRPRWQSMDAYISEVKRLTLDLVYDATHDRPPDDVLEECGFAEFLAAGGTALEWATLDIMVKTDQLYEEDPYNYRSPAYEAAQRSLVALAVEAARAGTVAELSREWWPGSGPTK